MSPVLWAVVVGYLAVFSTYTGLLLHRLVNARLDVAAARMRLLSWPYVRRRTERSLERRVVREVIAAGVVDGRRRVLWLPDSVEASIAPADLHTLGPTVEHVRWRILGRLGALAADGPCRFRARPVVLLTADPTGRPGRATVRLAFDESTDRVAMPDGDVRPGPWAQSGTTTARAYLRLVRPAGAPMRLRAGRPFRIGRLADCELAIEQPSVSRYHALVYERNGGWYVRDQGSTNGTFVNLAPVRGPVRLRNADELRLGATVTLRFELLPPPHVRAVAPS